jgi:hypothetical protein
VYPRIIRPRVRLERRTEKKSFSSRHAVNGTRVFLRVGMRRHHGLLILATTALSVLALIVHNSTVLPSSMVHVRAVDQKLMPSAHKVKGTELSAIEKDSMKRTSTAYEFRGTTDRALVTTDRALVRNVCDSAEFSLSVPHLKVTLVIFAWRRLTSLQRLIDSLQVAEYCGRELPLKVFVDGGALPEVRAYVHSRLRWEHGSLAVHMYPDSHPRGIRGMWINATAADIADDEHVIPLEDDIEVSPLYYWWLLRASRAYGPLGDGALQRARGLVGISLYTPRLNEIHYPQVSALPPSPYHPRGGAHPFTPLSPMRSPFLPPR